MEILAVKIEGFGNIQSLELDLRPFNKSLIAIAGTNGSGKTHLVEAMLPVALFRRLLSYDELVQDHFLSSGGRIETHFAYNGKEYFTVISGKYRETPVCYLFEQGDCIAGPGAREFDEAVSLLFPPRQLLLASSFAPQNSVHGFFDMSQKDRHVAFAHMIGLEDYDMYSSLAKEMIKEKKAELKMLKSVQEEVGKTVISSSKSESVEVIAPQISELEKEVAHIEGREVPQIEKTMAELREAAAARKEIEVALEKHRKRSLEIKNFKEHVGEASAINRAIADLEKDFADRTEELVDLRDKILSETEFMAELEDFRAEVLESAFAQMGEILSLFEQRLKVERKEQSARDKKAKALVDLGGVDTSHEMCKACPLTATARTIIYDYEKAKGAVAQARDLYLFHIERKTERLLVVQKEYARLDESWRAAIAKIAELEKQYALLQKEADGIDHEISAAKKRLHTIEISNAEVPIVAQYIAEAEEALKGTDPLAKEKLAAAEKLLREKVSLIHNIKSVIADLRVEMREVEMLNKMHEENEKKRKEVSGRIAELQEGMSTLSMLANIITKDRRRQIDYVLPSIQSITNSMLSNYQAGRFSVQMKTMKKKKSSDESKEDFTPTILDLASEFPRQKGSIGESAIISEALRMAIAVSMHPGGGNSGTLIRDEVAGNVDVENLDTYMEILRYGIRNNYFKNELFVCHMPHIIDRADAIIRMVKGKIVSVEA